MFPELTAMPTPTRMRSLIRGKEREALSLKEGDKLHGFTVTKVEQIDEYHITAVSLVHDVTGARYDALTFHFSFKLDRRFQQPGNLAYGSDLLCSC
jgi:hypothetical protein